MTKFPRVTFRLAYHHVIALVALLFVSLQTGALAHAAQYGDAPHQHDGAICELQAVSSEQDVIEPAAALLEVVFTETAISFDHVYISAPVVTPPGRAPPPRSPPTLSV